MNFPHLNGRAERLAQELGLAPDAAQWIALAALHSGCFLRSQYCAAQVTPGGNLRVSAERLTKSLIEHGLAVEMPVDGLGLLCRITSKTVYRAVGAADIRHRRLASWPIMRRRLLSLDYVLDCPDLPWLPTEAEKLACFDGLGVPREALPWRVYRGAGKQAKRYFANKHPIAVDPGSKSAVFVYADSDEQTSQGLRRWRGEHAALWSRLCSRGFRLSVVHVSRNPEIAKFVEGLFATWSRSAGGAANAAELTRELRRLEAALEKDDDAVFDEYGGFSRALSRAGKLERRLKQKNELGGYEAGHSVWLSSRIRPKGAWRNVLGPHQVEVEEGDDDEA